MYFFNISHVQFMKIAFLLTLLNAILNTAHKILLEQYGLDMFPYIQPFAIQDNDVRVIFSWVLVGFTYMLRNRAIKKENLD